MHIVTSLTDNFQDVGGALVAKYGPVKTINQYINFRVKYKYRVLHIPVSGRLVIHHIFPSVQNVLFIFIHVQLGHVQISNGRQELQYLTHLPQQDTE